MINNQVVMMCYKKIKNNSGIVNIANKFDMITIVKFKDVLPFIISVSTAEKLLLVVRLEKT